MSLFQNNTRFLKMTIRDLNHLVQCPVELEAECQLSVSEGL